MGTPQSGAGAGADAGPDGQAADGHADEHAAEGEGRHADWLELFFDLVFVALAAQLSHRLHGDPDLRDFAVFLGLYFPPWWLWINLLVSTNLFVDNSARRRLLMLSAMLCIAVMACAVPEADTDRGSVYALGYAGTRLVLLVVWAAGHLTPWLVVMLLAAEPIAHLLYARRMLRHRLGTAAAPRP